MSCLLAFCWGLDCTVYKAPVKVQLSGFFSLSMTLGREGKGRDGTGREGKGREGKGREGKGREGCLLHHNKHHAQAKPASLGTCICNLHLPENLPQALPAL